MLLSLISFLPTLRSGAFLFIAAIGIWRQFRSWLPHWRDAFGGRLERLWETFWLLISPVAVYTALAVLAKQQADGNDSPELEQNIALCVILLITIVLRNSWRLLTELPIERNRPTN